ncbi:MAG TPA: hypothetical protein VFO60_10575 [Candidatus Dormibacteraeota bacterium]|nr:hypothetical protein [Candidatus Dormibacteraeota bacterium]
MTDVLRVPPGVFEQAQGAFRKGASHYDTAASDLKHAAACLDGAFGGAAAEHQFHDAFKKVAAGLTGAGTACTSMAVDVLERLRQNFEDVDASQRVRVTGR